MKLYLIEDNRGENGPMWDIYLGAVVVANDSDDAKTIHPGGGDFVESENENRRFDGWVDFLSEIDVTELGEANPELERGVIFQSYQAG
jgi:hypothetical protein